MQQAILVLRLYVFNVQRTFTLQKDVMDIENIEAKYENGLLHLLIPKKEEAKQKPPRLIQIS